MEQLPSCLLAKPPTPDATRNKIAEAALRGPDSRATGWTTPCQRRAARERPAQAGKRTSMRGRARTDRSAQL